MPLFKPKFKDGTRVRLVRNMGDSPTAARNLLLTVENDGTGMPKMSAGDRWWFVKADDCDAVDMTAEMRACLVRWRANPRVWLLNSVDLEDIVKTYPILTTLDL